MSTRRGRGIPAELENVRRRFEDWRRTRTVRTRIPEPLWAAAVEMAKEYGIHRTAKILRIGYYGLKKRVEVEAPSSFSADVPPEGSVATFLELAAPVATGVAECILELEDGHGAKMRVHLKGVEAPDLAALSRSFWGVWS